MKRLIFVAFSVAASALVSSAQAQEKPKFSGFAAGASLSYARNSADFSGSVGNQEGKKSAGLATLDVSYGIPLTSQWTVSVGGTYDLNKPSFGTVVYLNEDEVHAASLKLKSHFSLYVAPGYQVTDRVQVYGKLAWHHARGEYSDSVMGTGSASHNGIGYGVGVATTLLPKVEARVELQQVRFNSGTVNDFSGKPSSNMATVYLGYRF